MDIAGRVLIPIVWTVGRPVVRGHSLTMTMCREALGVIVRDDAESRVFLVDGRVMSLEELSAEYPELKDPVSSLRQGVSRAVSGRALTIEALQDNNRRKTGARSRMGCWQTVWVLAER